MERLQGASRRAGSAWTAAGVHFYRSPQIPGPRPDTVEEAVEKAVPRPRGTAFDLAGRHEAAYFACGWHSWSEEPCHGPDRGTRPVAADDGAGSGVPRRLEGLIHRRGGATSEARSTPSPTPRRAAVTASPNLRHRPGPVTLLVDTRFQSLDGGTYQLYPLYNPSLAGSGGGDTGAWDATGGALVASAPRAGVRYHGRLRAEVLRRLLHALHRLQRHRQRRAPDLRREPGADQPVRHRVHRRQHRADRADPGRRGHDVHARARLRRRPRDRATSAASASLAGGFAAVESSYPLAGTTTSTEAATGSVSGDVRRRIYLSA